MSIELHPSFKKAYKKRISFDKKLISRVALRIELFGKDRESPILKDHSLTGNKSHLRAFWITGDIRIVYYPVSEDRVIFLDIGSHNQIY